MRVAIGLVVGGLVLTGCGASDGDGEASAGTTTPTPSATTPGSLDGDRPGRLAYPTPEALAKASPVVLLGTIASWEDGPTLVTAKTGGGDERVPYAVAVINVEMVLKDKRHVTSGATIAVPVLLEGDTPYEELAPKGSNVAFFGGSDVKPAATLEPGGPVDVDDLLWAEPQGLVLETPDGTLVNADPTVRTEVWPGVRNFVVLAQKVMALRG